MRFQDHVDHAPAATDAFLPHGFCYLWDKPLLWTHFTSDLLIGVSYVTISFSLAYLVHRARRDIPFSLAFVAFGLFIITCGLTHFMELWTLWEPVYWLSGGVKVVTAAASVATAVAMPFWVPRVHATVRDAKLARAREIAAARADALEEQNAKLEAQAIELARQGEAAQALAEELARTNAELRRAVAAAEEARAEAEEARLGADRANRSKSEFLAVMSHELRTPLNAIGGYAQLIELGVRGPVTDAQRLDLQRIERSQQHLLSLINDILNFSRLEGARVTYHLADVAVGEVLADAMSMIVPQAAGRALECVHEPCAGDVVASADPDKLHQVVLNLLSNAVKYTPPGGRVTVSCGVEGSDVGGSRVFVRVADTGIGIPPERQSEIFEPFVQLDRSLTRQYEGTGLGLAISRDLARGMGGELVVESALGAGATFTLWLPAAERRAAA